MTINRRITFGIGFLVFILLLGCESEKTSDISSDSVNMGYIKKVEDGDTVLAEVDERVILVCRCLGGSGADG